MPDRQLSVTCPYCALDFQTGISESYGVPFETECVAYTRDIGRFDPKDEKDWYSADKGWTRIGKDYLNFLFFERIGILRTIIPGISIRYKVQGCPRCKHLFDVYVNYSRDESGAEMRLKEIWPHVFQEDPKLPGGILPYEGLSWPLWLIHKLGKPFKSTLAGAVLLGLIITALGLLPWLFTLLNPDLSQGRLPLLTVQGLLYAVVIIGVIIILIVGDQYFRYLKNTQNFTDLMKVKDVRNVIHWQNYSMCRLVGVQQPGKLPQLSHVDIFTGGSAILSLLVAWMILTQNWSVLGWVLLGVGLVLLLVRSLSKLMQWLAGRKIARVVVWLVLGGVFVWGLVRLFPVLDPQSWGTMHKAFDLLFWMMVAYLLGTGTLLTENIGTYVLTTISKNSLNLSSYNNFKQIQPIRKLQSFSTSIILLLFFNILIIVSILLALKQLPASAQWQWLGDWASLGLAIIFIGMGFGSGKIRFITLVVIYVALEIFLRGVEFSLGNTAFPFKVDATLIVMGAFFTILLIQHLSGTESILKGLVDQIKEKQLADLDQQIDQVNRVLARNDELSESSVLGEELNQYHSLLGSLDSLLQIRQFLQNTGLKAKFRLAEILSPIAWSLVLPTIWNELLLALQIIEH